MIKSHLSLFGDTEETMSNAQVHFELFIRRAANQGWTLHLASEDRQRTLETAEELMAQNKAVAVRVTKETLDEETRGYRSATILSKGMVEIVKPKRPRTEDDTPLCVSPADLYTFHARDRINRLLEPWLKRKTVTAFELLHRPDLVEQLDASGVEIQHAIQKIAIPEAQARDISVHELIRGFQGLVERAIERLIKDGRRKSFPDITPASFGKIIEDYQGHADRNYLIGGGIARFIGKATSWTEKLRLLLDLADGAPAVGKARIVAFMILEQPLVEILSPRAGMNELLGVDKDLGAQLAAMTRMVADDMVEALGRRDRQMALMIPAVEGQTARLAAHLAGDPFVNVRATLAKRIVQELAGPRRLRPGDAPGEIAILRALAMALSAVSGKLVKLEEVEAAITERSRSLVTTDFVGSYLGAFDTAIAQANALVKLADNVTGQANKREAARWISSVVGALKFEREIREARDPPTAKLALLAELQKAVMKAGLSDTDQQECIAKIGEIGSFVEADVKLTLAIVRSAAPRVQCLVMLLRMAAGETAPLGPAADRAKIEALKLLKAPEFRAALGAAPEQLAQVRTLMGAIGLAA